MTSLQTCTYKMPLSIFSEVSPAATVASPLRPPARQLFDVLEEGGFFGSDGGREGRSGGSKSQLLSPVLDRQRRRPHRNGRRRRDPLQHTREKGEGIRREIFEGNGVFVAFGGGLLCGKKKCAPTPRGGFLEENKRDTAAQVELR